MTSNHRRAVVKTAAWSVGAVLALLGMFALSGAVANNPPTLQLSMPRQMPAIGSWEDGMVSVRQFLQNMVYESSFLSSYIPTAQDKDPPEMAEVLSLSPGERVSRTDLIDRMIQKYGALKTQEYLGRALPLTGISHLLVHYIGVYLYRQEGDRALQYCTENFLAGCQHGVIITAIADKGLEGISGIYIYCDRVGTWMGRACAHGIGHGLLAWVDYGALLDALEFCDRIGDTASSFPIFNCHDGVFMENVFGVHGGKPSEKRWIDRQDFAYPCNSVPVKYRLGCWANQGSIIYELTAGDLTAIVDTCDTIANYEFKQKCYQSLVRIINPMSSGDSQKGISLCRQFTRGGWRDFCLVNLMQATFALGDRSSPYQICDSFGTEGGRRDCYAVLASMINQYVQGAFQIQEACERVPRRFQVPPCNI